MDPPAWTGDAKVAGRAEEVTDPALVAAVNGGDAGEGAPSHLFRADVGEVVVVRLGEPADHLVIESWRPGRHPAGAAVRAGWQPAEDAWRGCSVR